MEKYIGSWSANGGSTYGDGYTGNNLQELARTMRSICRGNVFADNSGHWEIYRTADAGSLSEIEPVKSGRV